MLECGKYSSHRVVPENRMSGQPKHQNSKIKTYQTMSSEAVPKTNFHVGRVDDWWILDNDKCASDPLRKFEKKEILESGHATQMKKTSIAFVHTLMQNRNKLKMTQAELGLKLNITAADMLAFEKGQRVPSPQQIQRLNRYFNQNGLESLPRLGKVVKG